MRLLLPALFTAVLATPALGQEAGFVVMLGKDTVAVEKFTRTPAKLTGELASRMGVAGNRLSYEVTLGKDGRPTAALYRPRPLSGTPAANQPREVRLTFVGDSVKREAVFADSTSVRMLPAAAATPFVYPSYGMLEVAFVQLRKSKAPSLAVTTVGTGAGNPGTQTLTVGAGDVVSGTGGGLITLFRVDPAGKLLSVDASGTTQKLMATRETGADFESIAGGMKPLGVLSARGVAAGSIQQGVVFINYGRPQVRGRSVWGGLLVPPDTIWRLGANEATHLATSRELTFGDVVIPPGLYTLWLLNTTGAPKLVINKQVGQWGTQYDPAQDLAKVALTMGATPEHIEDFTISFRNLEPRKGAIEFAWGAQMATAVFTVK